MESLSLRRYSFTIVVCLLIESIASLSAQVLRVSDLKSEPQIISRDEWNAQPPANPPVPLKVLPPFHVIISHTAEDFCDEKFSCALSLRVIQTYHKETKGWNDIAYNFLVGGDGHVYEGRGWDVEGAHTYGYNNKSIGIAFMGNFNNSEPTKAQLIAASGLIEYGLLNGKIGKNYKLLGHRQCSKTESPGEMLYNVIKTWDHWSATC